MCSGWADGAASGGSVERWEEDTFRACFEDIFSGNWRKHDPYDITNRVNAKADVYGRADQVRPCINVQSTISNPC